RHGLAGDPRRRCGPRRRAGSDPAAAPADRRRGEGDQGRAGVMLAFLFSRAGAAVVGIVAALGLLTWSHLAAYRAGDAAARAEVLARSVEILRERNATDDE